MMIFETHAHYDDEQFDQTETNCLRPWRPMVSARSSMCAHLMSPAGRVTEMVKKYPFMYAAVGVHPDEVGALDEEKFVRMETLLDQKKVVAVGEIGLDYYWDHESHDLQKEWFIRQLELARKQNLPVLIHSREAAADTMEIMKGHAQGLNGVIHCYSYSNEMAKEYVKMGFYIGIGGVVTFKNAKKAKRDSRRDSAYFNRAGNRLPVSGTGAFPRQEKPVCIYPYVAEKIAEIKEISYEEVVAQTEKNARAMYSLDA